MKDWTSTFSDNIRSFHGYAIGKIFKYLDDPSIISLAGGLPSPDVFQKDQMRASSAQRLNDNIEKIMNYTLVTGELDLVDGIIRFLARDNIRVTPDQVLVTTAGQHGLDLTGRLFLNPGDPVIIDRPTFAGALVAFKMQRPEFIGIDMEEDGTNVQQIRQEVERLVGENRKPKFIYVVPDFQNPTGITLSLEKRHALLDLSYAFDVPLVEDSPYRDFRYRGETLPSLFSLDQKRDGDHVIGCYTFSKMFCPGIRVGFNIGPESIISRMGDVKGCNILNTPKYNQDMCTAFLTEWDLDAHFARCREFYSKKLNRFLATMEEVFPPDMGVTWTRPEGGLFLWVSVPESIDTLQLFHEAIKFKVAFVPGETFYAENPASNHMRINFSFASESDLEEAVRRLAKCITQQL